MKEGESEEGKNKNETKKREKRTRTEGNARIREGHYGKDNVFMKGKTSQGKNMAKEEHLKENFVH